MPTDSTDAGLLRSGPEEDRLGLRESFCGQMLQTTAFARVPLGLDLPNNSSLATPSAITSARRLRRRRSSLREWPAQGNHVLMSETSPEDRSPKLFHLTYK
jgi:hypothetical protein